MANSDSDDGNDQERNFEDCLDLLREKRASSRETALSRIENSLRSHYLADFLENRWETLTTNLCKSIVGGADAEKTKATDCLNILAMTLGKQEGLFEQVAKTLITTISDTANSDLVISACATALGNMCFFSSNDPHDTASAMELLQSHFVSAKTGPLATSAALSSWSLLLTSIPKQLVIQTLDRSASHLLKLLEHADVDVRIEAGSALALLFYLLRSDASEEEPFNIASFSSHLDVEHMMDSIITLSSSSSGRSKKDRTKEQPEFKIICKSLQEGEDPEETLTVKFQNFPFAGWSQMTQLKRVRNTLTTGLLTHLEQNEVLHEVFEMEVDALGHKQRLSAVDKRRFMSPNSARSKANTQGRNKDRDSRAARNSSAWSDNE